MAGLPIPYNYERFPEDMDEPLFASFRTGPAAGGRAVTEFIAATEATEGPAAAERLRRAWRGPGEGSG